MRCVVTPRGSRFLLCERSRTDPNYPKYPPQPVVTCAGYQARTPDPEVGQSAPGEP